MDKELILQRVLGLADRTPLKWRRMGLLWNTPTLTPQAKAGHLSRSRGMIPACWLGTDVLSPHLYTSPTCLFTQNPFTPPALAFQPQGPKLLTHWFLPFRPEQVAVPQGLQACQLLTPLPPWPLLVCLCVWPANREAGSCSLVLGALASNISKVSDLSWLPEGFREGRPWLPDRPAFSAYICQWLCCSTSETFSVRPKAGLDRGSACAHGSHTQLLSLKLLSPQGFRAPRS